MEYVGKSWLPRFLVKTYMMVDDPATNAVVSWNFNGTTFVVWRPIEFARDLLPMLFKHDNFASFVRQLNAYGFHKVSSDRCEFGNKLFHRGAIDQLREICRKKARFSKAQHQVQLLKASSSSSELTNLVGENKRLQQENDVLSSELVVVKDKFKKLRDLAVDYTKNSETQESVSEGPKLFGVRLRNGAEND